MLTLSSNARLCVGKTLSRSMPSLSALPRGPAQTLFSRASTTLSGTDNDVSTTVEASGSTANGEPYTFNWPTHRWQFCELDGTISHTIQNLQAEFSFTGVMRFSYQIYSFKGRNYLGKTDRLRLEVALLDKNLNRMAVWPNTINTIWGDYDKLYPPVPVSHYFGEGAYKQCGGARITVAKEMSMMNGTRHDIVVKAKLVDPHPKNSEQSNAVSSTHEKEDVQNSSKEDV